MAAALAAPAPLAWTDTQPKSTLPNTNSARANASPEDGNDAPAQLVAPHLRGGGPGPTAVLQRVVFRNVTGSVDLGVPIDLKLVHCALAASKYEPAKFCGLRFKLESPKATLLLFASGKMVCTGSKTPELCRAAAKQAARLVRRVTNTQVKFSGFGIRNMVATVNTGLRLDIEEFAMDNCEFCSYNPETFSGVIAKIPCPKACCLVFSSGKMVVTGIVTREGLNKAVEFLMPRLALVCHGFT